MTNFNNSSSPNYEKIINPIKDQIIGKAINFHKEGNIAEALKHYQFCVNKGFDDYRVFSNFGNILQQLGKLEEAAILSRKAVDLKPNLAHVHFNLGNILKELGRLEEAEISHRKAIKLNPNLTQALNALGDILLDVGKLKEVILLSKSKLESKSITPEDKLRALIQIICANLQKGDFPETLLYLNKINELIEQGLLYIIKDIKTRQHSWFLTQFISSIYNELEKNSHNSYSEKIPHIGESHCLSFAHQTLSISSKVKKIQPVMITGGKAWHFSNSKNNNWKESLTQQIKNHTYSNEILISFGEIDCRKNEGILSYVMKKDKDISEVCKKTINGYLNHMELSLSFQYPKRFYFGVPAPTIKEESQDELDKKRIELIKIYNLILKKEVLSRGAYFLDVYDLTSNLNGENNNKYMCDKIHLSPKCLSILFENHLHKP